MITDLQRKQRSEKIGSSDAPQIVGVSPFVGAGPARVYWSKPLGRWELPPDDPTDAMQVGNLLEAPLLEMARERTKLKIRASQYRVGELDGGVPVCANTDGLVEESNAPVECKYTSGERAEEFGADGSDQVPAHVLVQVHHQMLVLDAPFAIVAAALAGRWALDIRLYRVGRSDALIQLLADAERDFWLKHVVPGVPPDDEPAPLAVLMAIQRVTGKSVELDDAIAMEVRDTKRQADEWEAKYKASLARAVTSIGDAQVGQSSLGKLRIIQHPGVARLDEDQMRTDGVHAKYLKKPAPYRYAQFYPKKGKSNEQLADSGAAAAAETAAVGALADAGG